MALMGNILDALSDPSLVQIFIFFCVCAGGRGGGGGSATLTLWFEINRLYKWESIKSWTYSDLENHICWKEPRDANMLPPIQTLYKHCIIIHLSNMLEAKIWQRGREWERSNLNLLSVAFPLANTLTLAAWGDS